jgi:hypothetical protein
MPCENGSSRAFGALELDHHIARAHATTSIECDFAISLSAVLGESWELVD